MQRTLTPTEVDMVRVCARGVVAMVAGGLVYVQWQMVRISDDDYTAFWGPEWETRASGWDAECGMLGVEL